MKLIFNSLVLFLELIKMIRLLLKEAGKYVRAATPQELVV